MRFVALVACAVGAVASADFDSWMAKFGKSYTGDERIRREAIFNSTVQEIVSHKAKLGPASWKGLNEFSAMTKEEFAKERLIPKFTADAITCLANGVTVETLKIETLKKEASVPRPATPAAWDWVTQGVVSPIQDQGQCGSPWAFSAVSAVESAWAVNTSNLIKLSEQELVDCSTACVLEDGQLVCNAGCNGGWMWSALTDVESWGGLNTAAAYPYTAMEGSCKRTANVFAPVTSYTCLSGPNSGGPNYADEVAMMDFSWQHGPLSVAMDASVLQTYTSGVIVPAFGDCSTTQLDMALNIVGWGQDPVSNIDYWKVRNSWGASWGEEGYFRIIFGAGACGINAGVVFPNVA